MRVIESYSDYLIAVRDQTSDLRYVRTEAINALQNLRNSKPEKFAEYKARQEEAKKPKPKSAQGRAYEKERYIQEHPNINIKELREDARERMQKDKYGFGLNLDRPVWITEEDLLKSVDQLSVSDLITSSGKPITRQSIIKKCIKIAVADRRIDEKKLRDCIHNYFCSYCNGKIINLKSPQLYNPLRTIIMEGATVEELIKITDGTNCNIGELMFFIDRKVKQMPDFELKRLERLAEKKAARKARKKAKWEALKAEQEALGKNQKTN